MRKIRIFLFICISLLAVPLLTKADDLWSATPCEKLVTNLLLPTINQKLETYYGKELSEDIMVYNYEVAILKMEAPEFKPPTVTLQFTVMIGAHNPVADYEMKLEVENSSDINILDFKLLKIYPETIERFNLTIPKT